MTERSTEDLTPRFMLAEYERVGASFVENEELGERRLNFLLTLVAALLTVIAAILELGGPAIPASGVAATPAGQAAAVVIVSTLVLVFLFGLLTLERTLKRNLATDDHIDALNGIRRYFIEQDPGRDLTQYLVFYSDEPKGRERPSPWSLRPGGIAQSTAVVNSVVALAIVAFLLSLTALPLPLVFAASALVGFGVWWGQCRLMARRYRRGRRAS